MVSLHMNIFISMIKFIVNLKSITKLLAIILLVYVILGFFELINSSFREYYVLAIFETFFNICTIYDFIIWFFHIIQLLLWQGLKFAIRYWFWLYPDDSNLFMILQFILRLDYSYSLFWSILRLDFLELSIILREKNNR